MKATLKSFSKSNKYEGKVVITVTQEAVDVVTGLVTELKYHYIVVPNYYYKNLVGKQVELELTKSPVLGFDVVTKITVELEKKEA